MDAPNMYPPGARALQEQFDTVRLADRLVERTVSDELEDWHVKTIERASFFFLGTVDADGFPDVSYKGGAPGFVRVIDRSTLAFPSYDGNGMYRSMGNIADEGKLSMLFIDFEKPKRVRIHGTGIVHREADWLDRFEEAELVVEVHVGRAFFNCPRYIHNLQNGELSRHAPRAGHVVEQPEWKQLPEWNEVLPHNS
jgi:predicted pyridoxine 5'-phosphate oxidase superfamily flavin-nucleotide-binding protein